MSTFQSERTDAHAPNDGSRVTGSAVLPRGLARHRGFAQIFQPNKLTFGFIAPLKGHPDSPSPTLENHVEFVPSPTLENHVDIVRKTDELGIAALWLRDVPFYDPSFGDVGQVMDPMVYAGFLATVTRRMTIGRVECYVSRVSTMIFPPTLTTTRDGFAAIEMGSLGPSF
jgi:hypothetical protein